MSTLPPEPRAETLVAMTVSHAAKITSLRQTDIRTAIQDGTLPALRMGRRLLILTPDLLDWLDNLKQAQAAEVTR